MAIAIYYEGRLTDRLWGFETHRGPLNSPHGLKNGKNAPNTEKIGFFSALRYPSGTLTSQLFPSSVAGDVQIDNRGFGPLGAL